MTESSVETVIGVAFDRLRGTAGCHIDDEETARQIEQLLRADLTRRALQPRTIHEIVALAGGQRTMVAQVLDDMVGHLAQLERTNGSVG